MSDGLNGLRELLRIRPCEAQVGRGTCKSEGDTTLTAEHPQRPKQTAKLCAKHAKVVKKQAEAVGYTVTLS